MTVQNGASEPDPSGSYRVPPTGIHFHHGVLNLPATAVEFLDAFNGAFNRDRWKGPLPIVHVYAFARGDEGDAGMLFMLRCCTHAGILELPMDTC